MTTDFSKRLEALQAAYQQLIARENKKELVGNGVFDRYQYPVLTNQHTPLFWRYDLNKETNPFLMERFAINAVFNAGAIKLADK